MVSTEHSPEKGEVNVLRLQGLLLQQLIADGHQLIGKVAEAVDLWELIYTQVYAPLDTPEVEAPQA